MANNGVKAWSYSRYSDYRQCPAKFKYKHIDKLPDPAGPAAARGTAIHAEAEAYLKAEKTPRKVPESLKRFESFLKSWRSQMAQAETEIVLGPKWGLLKGAKNSRLWFHPDAWLRAKLDVYAPASTKSVVVADWKTGKRRDDHVDQAALYGLTVLLSNKRLLEAVVHMLYVDQDRDNMLTLTVLRDEVPALLERWNASIAPMFKDRKFAPKPGPLCGWCNFSKGRGGPCQN